MKRRNWNDNEIDVVLNNYFAILKAEQAGEKVNKAAFRRAALALLDNRSAGSYEMKMCNVSAAMQSLGKDWIFGYKPLGNAQKSLTDAIKNRC